ncbi:MAG: glycosyltransferase family 4 protein [Gammaproteobacteria bacterium]|nr:glycosyltransferase family 4 protein [Gammaproteobacteria bacterium]
MRCKNSSEDAPYHASITRILAIIGSEELFGQERANIEVLRAAREKGAEVKFVTSRKFGGKEIDPHLRELGFDIVKAPFGYYWGKYLLTWKFFYFFVNIYGIVSTNFIVWKEARRWKATCVYGGNWLHLSYAILGIVALRIPLVFRAGDEFPKSKVIRMLVGKPVMKRISRLVCNCEFLRSCFREIPGCPDSITVIYNHPPFRANQEKIVRKIDCGISEESNVILFVGQITLGKGVDLLVKAALKLLEEGEDIVLWIIGSYKWNKLSSELEQIVKEKGFHMRIRFLGYRSDVASLMRRADIHVCSSIWNEPSPNVIFEAKREGVPSVAFPVGGVPELIENKLDGVLCERKSVSGLCEGLRYFLSDKSLRAKAGRAARRSLEERFGYERFREEWSAVFTFPSREN